MKCFKKTPGTVDSRGLENNGEQTEFIGTTVNLWFHVKILHISYDAV